MYDTELIVRHVDQCLSGTHPIGTSISPRTSGRSGWDVNDQDPPAFVSVFLDRDASGDAFEDAGFRAAGLGESARTNDPPGADVGYSEYHLAPTLIGERNAVPDEVTEIVAIPGLLELEPGAFGRRQVAGEVLGRRHDGSPARAKSSAKS